LLGLNVRPELSPLAALGQRAPGATRNGGSGSGCRTAQTLRLR